MTSTQASVSRRSIRNLPHSVNAMWPSHTLATDTSFRKASVGCMFTQLTPRRPFRASLVSVFHFYTRYPSNPILFKFKPLIIYVDGDRACNCR